MKIQGNSITSKTEKIKKHLDILVWLVFGLSIFIYMQGYEFKTYADDWVYKNTFQNYSNWFEWARDYYMTWSGRVVIHTLLIAVLNLPVIVWRALVAGGVTITIVYLIKIAELFCGKIQSIKKRITLIVCACVLSIYLWPMFNDWAFTWCSGSLNYLFPGCGLLICLYPYLKNLKDKEVSKSEIILAAVAGLITSSSEQTAAVFLVFTCLITIYGYLVNKKKTPVSLLVMMAVIDILSLVSILAPGNAARSHNELSWYPSYDMFGLQEKFILGMQHHTGLMSNNKTVLFLLLMCIALIILNRKNVLNVILASLGLLGNLAIIGLTRLVFSEWYINPCWSLYLIWMFIMLAMVLYNSWLLYTSVVEYSREVALALTLLFYAGIASSVMTAVSPTIYSSGIRVFYLYQIFMLTIDIVLLVLIFKKINTQASLLKNKEALICISIGLILTLGFVALFKMQNTTKQTSIDQLVQRDSIEITDTLIREKSGFTQIDLTARDNDCNFTFFHWVIGEGQANYLVCKMIVKVQDKVYEIPTYPKPDSDIDYTYKELRGYIPTKLLDGDYEIGIVTMDRDGNELGYRMVN